MSNAKDDNSVNLNPEEFSLGIKISPTTEIAPATKTTAKSEIVTTTKEIPAEEFSWTALPGFQSPQSYPKIVSKNQNLSCRTPMNSQSIYCPSNIPNITPFPYAGLTSPMMQQINNQVVKGLIDIDLSIIKYRAMSEEKLRQKQILDQYEDSRKKNRRITAR